ncbi:hypothetical protein MRB53_017271 [Persea americana]|uniref:Uncharacterized protein n=1 Tax=Persea americana TaxID=3435 RepID=A0ACC2M5Y2_PERAE|nr:hypothetical protein MRB53_017271 [Persea americana]
MRFRKGSKVEVLSQGGLPSGAWRPAEIILGNGRHYSVRYYQPVGNRDDAVVERVPRKAIRPCPPVRGEIWGAGDMVEVFDNNLWKVSKVLRPLDRNYFLVTLFRPSLEIRVHKSHIRVQQSWQDGQWVVIGQNSRSGENREPDELQMEKYILKTNCELLQQDVNSNAHIGNDRLFMEHTISLQGCQRASSRSTKRRSEFCSLHIETQMEAGWKRRAIEKDGRSQQLVSQCPSQLHEKVENYMQASFNNGMIGFSETGTKKQKLNAGERNFGPTRLEPNDAESSASCSVASCGSSDHGPYMLPHHSIGGLSVDSDDAESSSGREYGRRCSSLSGEEWVAKLHKLELRAYHSTMEALYASGPLSWEQEAMITNLRLSLHISNDEHLLEVRHLVST